MEDTAWHSRVVNLKETSIMAEDSIVFTPAALIDLLSSIDELAGEDLGLVETLDGKFQLTVGDSNYLIETDRAETVDVEEDVVETVDGINEAAYEDLEDYLDLYDGDLEEINSGLIKETLKTLALGGMIRLAGKLIK